PIVREYLGGSAVGTTMQNLNQSILLKMSFGLPPLPEQKRIVAKVDELMKLCDELEARQAKQRETGTRLTKAALEGLANADGPAELEAAWERVVGHFEGLISRAEDVKKVRETVLSLAVRGRLVGQEAGEGLVDELLETNDANRANIARDDARADAETQSILSADDRWDIPDSWVWRGLADLVLFVDYRGKTPTKITDGVRLLTAKNVRRGHISLSPEEFVSEREYEEWMVRGLPKTGDVLFTTEAPMGNAAVVRLAARFALAQRVICLQSYGGVAPEFLVLQILSDEFQAILDKNGTGMTAKGIKGAKLKQLPIAIPPLPEQKRIVAKVDQLMALCDTLETKLRESELAARKVAEALVAELLQA
ncbi:MAG TPA: restriction endonuclease subunit S, partial [Polyangium sp.]|nr:restriction endonuclease subunit S [Polyangium sp.]